jgi:outer membrane protein assembly factor BamB
MNPAATGHGKSPKSTPVVSGGKLFTFGINGVLSCFDAKSGKLNWRKEFSTQYPNTSPIVANGLCIVHLGGHDKGALTAFDIEMGAVKWANAEDGPAYSSPVLTTLAGEPQLVTYTRQRCGHLRHDWQAAVENGQQSSV